VQLSARLHVVIMAAESTESERARIGCRRPNEAPAAVAAAPLRSGSPRCRVSSTARTTHPEPAPWFERRLCSRTKLEGARGNLAPRSLRAARGMVGNPSDRQDGQRGVAAGGRRSELRRRHSSSGTTPRHATTAIYFGKQFRLSCAGWL